MPVRRTEGLDPREHRFLVHLPRCWGEADTLDQAIENAKANLPDTDKEEVEGTVYLVTPETQWHCNTMTGETYLDKIRGETYLDAEPETEWVDEGNGIEVKEVDDGEDKKLEFLTNIVVLTKARPRPEEM